MSQNETNSVEGFHLRCTMSLQDIDVEAHHNIISFVTIIYFPILTYLSHPVLPANYTGSSGRLLADFHMRHLC